MKIKLSQNQIIIADTSVLINFLNVDRLDLLTKYAEHLYISEHVLEEITGCYISQKQKLHNAIKNNTLSIIVVNQIDELILFTKLHESGRLGAGECSAIACAICRNYTLAMDDVRARKQAEKMSQNVRIINTQAIMLSLITQKKLTIAEADQLKNEWRDKHKFLLKFASFDELIKGSIDEVCC